MKRPVSWHEECLKNMTTHLINERKMLENHRVRVRKLMNSVTLAKQQIDEAKRRGLDAFDDERFLIKRKSPTKL